MSHNYNGITLPLQLSDRDQKVLRNLISCLRENLDGRLKQVIVYGSRVRGNHNAASDLDVLVVVNQFDKGLKKRIRQIRYQVMWEANFEPLISLLCMEETEFKRGVKRGDSLVTNIEREGNLVCTVL